VKEGLKKVCNATGSVSLQKGCGGKQKDGPSVPVGGGIQGAEMKMNSGKRGPSWWRAIDS